MSKYGYDHQRIRAQLLPYAIGQPCHFCGEVMKADDDLDLDHSPDGRGYRGVAHAACNRRDGALRQHIKQSRRW